MLKAGVLEELKYHDTETGTPQGSIVSPLLANVYMHQLDEWAAEHSHRLTGTQKHNQRRKGNATIRLTRYADDFVIAVKGTREQAEEIKTEVAEFLKTTMRMELSLEKTRITHRTEGFEFLGIHIRYDLSWHRMDSTGQRLGNVYDRPSDKAIRRYKAKVKELTSAATFSYNEVEVVRALNRFTIGWGNYYRHANSAYIFGKLENWTWHRVFRWLQHKHKMPAKTAYRHFRVAPTVPINKHSTRKDWRLGAWDDRGNFLAVWPLSFIPIRYWKYRGSRIPQKFEDEPNTRLHPGLPDYDTAVWPENDNPRSKAAYRNVREIVKERDRYQCQKCGNRAIGSNGHIHHKDGNPANQDLENLELLCIQCHQKATIQGSSRK
jgi:5-methylcytosine-specific restriction endonuclease McrA